jgi:hypothetical protein
MPSPQPSSARLNGGEASSVSGNDANTRANAAIAAQRRSQCLIADLFVCRHLSER